ncbi:DUF3908 family protein [Bacillus massiliglaciei]|uniref:DUF3908 family protein n=1 Tax=Bacillus massiliglaciei TaxID=1816693 RepID=UPI0018FE8FDA|nr:DUF3908 family protein [Bacillus massiliglaciei]
MVNSFQKFQDEVNSGLFENQTLTYKKFLKKITHYINKDNVRWFYARNIYNGEGNKELIILFEKHFALVTIESKEMYKVDTIPFNLDSVELSLSIPEYDNDGVDFKICNNGEVVLKFNSKGDSNNHWNDEYIKAIQDLYRILSEQK